LDWVGTYRSNIADEALELLGDLGSEQDVGGGEDSVELVDERLSEEAGGGAEEVLGLLGSRATEEQGELGDDGVDIVKELGVEELTDGGEQIRELAEEAAQVGTLGHLHHGHNGGRIALEAVQLEAISRARLRISLGERIGGGGRSGVGLRRSSGLGHNHHGQHTQSEVLEEMHGDWKAGKLCNTKCKMVVWS
jgi:hypothetical protein